MMGDCCELAHQIGGQRTKPVCWGTLALPQQSRPCVPTLLAEAWASPAAAAHPPGPPMPAQPTPHHLQFSIPI